MSYHFDSVHDSPFPLESQDLLRALEAIYPHRCARPGEALESIHRYAGARAVVDLLLNWKARTDEDARGAEGVLDNGTSIQISEE